MPQVKVLLFMLISLPAHAELYRWIDPESGSVKLSTLPPSDPRIDAQVVPYKGPASPPPTAAATTQAMAVPAPPNAGGIGQLESRWSDLLSKITGLTPTEVAKGGDGLRQHVEAYEAVSAELDRLDPAGAARRKAQSETMFERLKKGLAAQFGSGSPKK
jgi:hypothetical protein